MASLIGQTVSHYRILGHLGGGGMGVVYKAEDLRLKRIVALKFLPPELTRDLAAKERFIQEAQAASALQHNNICVIHDIEETIEGQMFIVMELYEGETLNKRIERGSLGFDEVADIASQIADGLGEAHRHGLLHRDIKPANIILTHRGAVKIVDFGLAKLVGQTRITRQGMTSGTAAYMSPEQARGEEVDSRTDIWSFGVVLHEMLTGQLPFRGDHPLALMYAIVNETPEDLSRLRPGVPEKFRALCALCLEKERGKRLPDLSEARKLLGGPPDASPGPWRFFPGRTRILRWAVLGGSLGLVAALVWVLAPAKSILMESTDYLVVADVENRTRESVFDHSLTEALKVSLRQSAKINILPAERVATAMTLLQVPDSRPLDEGTAIAVARREGARAVVAASISRLGSTYLLVCGIIDGNTGETVRILREEVPRIEGVLSGMDRLCENVRRTLGESMSQISRAREPLEEVTTSSLEALDLYSRSGLFTSEGKYREAATLLQQAVSIDSQFVMAISDLAYCYRKTGNDSLAALYHERILPVIHRVTERERLEILAIYYGPFFEIDFQKADECLRKLTLTYPNDAYAFATLGHLAMSAGDTKGALEANAKAVALYRDYDKTCYNNSGFALALNGEPAEALVWFRKAKALRPSYPAIDMYMALTHWMNGDLDSSETLLRSAFPTAGGPQRNQLRVVLSSLYFFQGKLSKARDLCLDGSKECRLQNRPGDEAYFHFLLGEIAAAEGKTDEYRAYMRNAAALSISPYFDLVFVGRSFARSGMIGDAERVIAQISRVRSFDPLFLRRRSNVLGLLRGELLLAKGEYGRAREHFQSVSRVQAGDPFYFLARQGIAECALRTADSIAPALCDSLLAHRGEMMMGSLSSLRQTGFWTRWLWPDLQLELGQLYASTRERAAAEKNLSAAMRYWKNAEPGDRRAAAARALLSKLTKTR